ncbi:SCO7613 C-terminal domain-containing membrane protein [Guptibacillus sedimenti]|uniref:SCO7613 C-terminal domain-containing membrane protein n=1 Tax=Guptibacillus sedimenti TaxID=3025680 RepID=UPI002362E700|nr:hypothetical protein [Pseudalkalibacillus sedimenti]
MNEQEREELFLLELRRLRSKNYITDQTFEVVSNAYEKMIHPSIEVLDAPIEQEEVLAPPERVPAKPAPVKEKKVKSTQELRDRNLTWILIIGVVFLLLGALVLATSTWDVMTSIMKTALIGGIAAVFFGISWLSGHKLRIEKTAFSFLVLGSLFLPIVVFSAGYFQLFGGWLSVSGAGNEVLGLIGVFLCLPLYFIQANRQHSRLFVWFSFVTLSIGVAFFIQVFQPTVDLFYLGIVIFNGLLLLFYTSAKKFEHLVLFTKELPIYAQGNLILSTLLLLFFYESEVFYSFNVIVTAFLYLAMIYIGRQKDYHFVFTFLLIYGIYQLIEHSVFESADVMLYALVGFIFIGLQSVDRLQNMKKAFQLTSGVVSLCAFIFITYKGLILRYDDPSWLLVLGYVIISINYIALANVTRYRIFGFLAPLFLAAAGLYSMSLLYTEPSTETVMLHMFATGFLLYAGGFYWNEWDVTKRMQTGALFISFGPILLSLLLGLVSGRWWLESSLLLVLGFLYLSIYQKGKWKWLRFTGALLNPITWGVALLALYSPFARNDFYENTFGLPFHTAIVAILVVVIHYFWRKKDAEVLEEMAFWTGVSFYGLSLLLLLTTTVDELFVRSGLFLGSVGMLYLIFKRTKEETLWPLLSLFTLGTYLSIAEAFPIQGMFQWIPGAVLLILIADTLGKKDIVIQRGYFYLGHLYLPAALIYTVSEHENEPVLYVIALFVYVYSMLRRKIEWEIRTFLYAAFTVLPFLYIAIVGSLEMQNEAYTYIGFVPSLVMFGLWLVLGEKWKERIKWYAVPFAVFGLFLFINTYEEIQLIPLAVGLFYAALLLYVMHQSDWQLFSIVPLLFVQSMIFLLPIETVEIQTLVYVGAAVVLLTTGSLIHHKLYSLHGKRMHEKHIDWYAVIAFLFVLNLYQNLTLASLWADELRALFIVAFFFLQIKRVPAGIPTQVMKTAAALSLFVPYYTLLHHLEINEYIVMEVYLLPWLAVSIYLSKRTWDQNKQIMSMIEWGVLLVVAAILVFDALSSNTIYDALIVGGLSLASVLAGFFYRIKSYFLIGCSVLLLNLLLQTRPYWGNMPWWAYLLIAGATLISVASFYEWQKQNKNEEGETLLQVKKQQLLAKWKLWR